MSPLWNKTDAVGSRPKFINLDATPITAGSFVVGKMYKILVPGTTDFTLIGADNSDAGTKFIATGIGTGTGTANVMYQEIYPTGTKLIMVDEVEAATSEAKALGMRGAGWYAYWTHKDSSSFTAGSFVTGKMYEILTAGTTDFTLIGADDSNAGTQFIATGAGTGTGTAAAVRQKVEKIVAITDSHPSVVGDTDSDDVLFGQD